ncbi:hypothetical protein [Candidatus Pristimantibacillus sp. PTI5]|uniref:hypothetical protein n=1 Tax=Candidatus Pristimantibacillus sp. PTI5 TaxID=3400422 RepID=UPI003B029AD3
MSKFKKILCLTLLISVCMFPASAFAASSKDTSNNKKSFLSSIFSVFTVTKSNNSNNNNNQQNNSNNHSNSNSSNNNKVDKDWDSKGWFDWLDDDDWWDEINWWDKNKDDSFKIWERYYCY